MHYSDYHSVSQAGEAVIFSSHPPFLIPDHLFSGKIRVRLLTKLLLNPTNTVYLRGLEKELCVSSNTVRLELNKLSQMHLIEVRDDDTNAKTKQYSANRNHPLFASLRSIILHYVGLDQILEQIIQKLGNVDKVYLTGDLASGKPSTFVDLVIVGDVDKKYLYTLVDKVEPLINKKVRVGLFSRNEFKEEYLRDLGSIINLSES